jgi:predicted esterase
MKPFIFKIALSLFAILYTQAAAAFEDSCIEADNGYTIIVEGYDWGPAVSKVILNLNQKVKEADAANYMVLASRSSDCIEIKGENARGKRNVTYAYVSDAKGNRQDEGMHITLLLTVGPNLTIGSPIQYSRNENCRGNNWINYEMIITDKASMQVWNKEIGRIRRLVDEFDLSGKFTHKDITMSYAAFSPKAKRTKSPLIIWLHGGGEGGTDASIPLIANRAANYASPEIQAYFGGAYVLAPQCPGAWMHNAEGVTTRGKENDRYNEGLMALIKNYVASNPGIDTDRIYVGGCSNGGYMTLKLVLLYPDYFAAAFPSALAYHSEFLSDEQIKSIKDVPMWLIHSADDPVTVADKTAVPVYKRLIEAGASDVHFSFYDHVVDITGFFGGENYHYSGHWSWIYSHANECTLDFDGQPVKINGRAVTLMEWMASQSK